MLLPAPTHNRSCEGVGRFPSQSQPCAENVVANSNPLRPLNHSGGFAIKRDASAVASVPSLLLGRGPLAVLWAIVSVVVLALNAQSVWALSHIGQEVCEGLTPSIANTYPPGSVSRPVTVIGIVAAPLHVHPSNVGSGIGHAMFPRSVPTGLRPAPDKASAANRFLNPAVTLAKPQRVSPVLAVFRNCNQMSKSSPRNNCSTCHA